MKVSVDIDSRGVEDAAAALAAGGLTSAAARALLESAQRLEAEIIVEVRARLTKYPRGALARSWRTTLEQDDRELTATVASRLPYARVQDEGGTIRPVRARMLAIPIRGPGGPKLGQGPRQFPGDLHVEKTPKGRLVLVDEKGRARFVLRAETRIPGASYMQAALASAPPEGLFERLYGRELDAADPGFSDAEP